MKNQKSINPKLLDFISKISTINLVVILIFFFTWCSLVNYMLDLGVFFAILFGLSPFILLVSVCQYKSIIAYAVVTGIFLFSIFEKVLSLPYYIRGYIRETWPNPNKDDLLGLINNFSCCLICEINDLLILITFSFIAISLMHNRRMVDHYNWSSNYFYKTFMAVFFLLILKRIVFAAIGY